MKWILFLLLAMPNLPVHAQSPASFAHVSSTFHFTVNAPMREAAPLFGPEGERAWAGKDWEPHFVFPAPARDVEGAVFTVQHGEHTAVPEMEERCEPCHDAAEDALDVRHAALRVVQPMAPRHWRHLL